MSTRRKTSRSKDENQQQTHPTYDAEAGNQTWAILVGCECSHPCAIPAPVMITVVITFVDQQDSGVLFSVGLLQRPET